MSSDALELGIRKEIYDLVEKFPGLHMREIQRKLNLSISHAEYHLNFLEKSELLTSIEDDNYKRYYVMDANTKEFWLKLGYNDKKILGLLRQKIPLNIVLFLLKNHKALHSEIAGALNLSPSKLSFHLKKLQKYNVIRKLSRDEGKGYAVVDEKKIVRLLITNEPPKDMLDELSDLWDSLDLGLW
jgi:predicted transcriptional regulator